MEKEKIFNEVAQSSFPSLLSFLGTTLLLLLRKWKQKLLWKGYGSEKLLILFFPHNCLKQNVDWLAQLLSYSTRAVHGEGFMDGWNLNFN